MSSNCGREALKRRPSITQIDEQTVSCSLAWDTDCKCDTNVSVKGASQYSHMPCSPAERVLPSGMEKGLMKNYAIITLESTHVLSPFPTNYRKLSFVSVHFNIGGVFESSYRNDASPPWVFDDT